MNENPVLDKSFNFALRIIKLYKYLTEEKREFVLSKELLVSGTNIGKHVKEAVNAETRAVFINEMSVARRKTSETEYWLELLHQADFLSDKQFDSMNANRKEIFGLLTSIVKTSKQNV
jgi:four helix bundle protein